MQQVLLNLLLNAFDAMKDVAPRSGEFPCAFTLTAIGRVEVSVRDAGIGLTMTSSKNL